MGLTPRKWSLVSILFRDVLPYATFIVSVVRANDAIKSRVESLDNINFLSHQGFWNPEIRILDHSGRYPGVHLNDEGNRKYLRSIRDCIQGSNLALANLLNASCFLQKASRNCHHLLFLACENSHINQIMQQSIRCMANSVDTDQPASEEAGCSGSTLCAGRKLKMLNWFCLSINAVYVYLLIIFVQFSKDL